jgi:hypothetical protein
MNLSDNQRFRNIMAFLALAAVAILLGLGTHGHHDDCHDYCWVCHSSIGAIGLPAVTFLIVIVWVYRSITTELVRVLRTYESHPHSAPRAPPA